MPIDSKLDNWNKENCPISTTPVSPERTATMKYTQPRIILKSLEKEKYSVSKHVCSPYSYFQCQSDESSHDEEEETQQMTKSPLEKFAHPPPHKVAKLLFALQN